MSTAIVALLVVAAIALLVRTWLGGRRDRDPAASVHSFQRALTAMDHETTGSPRAPDREHDRPSGGETVTRR